MCLKHLTDAEVQTYLDSGRTEMVDRVETHLVNCEPCRNAVERYARLYTEIKSVDTDPVADGFSDRVMARVAVEPLPETHSLSGWLVPGVGVPVAVAASVASLYYTGLLPESVAWISAARSSVESLVTSYVQTFKGLGISPVLLVGVAGVTFLGSQIDRLRKLVNRAHVLA